MKAKIARKTRLIKQNFTLGLLVVLLVTLMAFSITAIADTEDATTGNTPSAEGLEINKTATYNESTNDYTITLEAYATGSKVTTTDKKEMPTDIVLVLDQSGSMDDKMGGLAYKEYSDRDARNSNLYNKRHNGGINNLYHKLPNGKYVSVSVEKKSEAVYTELSTSSSNSIYYKKLNNLYEKVGDDYQKVTVERSGNAPISGNYTYTYTFPDGTKKTSPGRDTKPDLGTHTPLYERSSVTRYTYYYTTDNDDGTRNKHEIDTSDGDNTEFNTLYYQYTDSVKTKLEVLGEGAEAFINDVAERSKGADGKAGTADDVNHRIAVVGFASTGNNKSDYTNTELLSTSNVVNYRSANDNNYKDALVDAMDNGAVNSRLTTAIGRLAASGDTYLEYGMDMANKIFAQYPVTKDDKGKDTRQRVVVVFTDGYPAPYGTNTFNYTMANNAISNAGTTKSNYGATVYTIAVLQGADPTANIENDFVNNGTTTDQQKVASNRYLHYVSSNYLSATSMTNGGTLNPKADPFNEGASYYLVAADASALNDIFREIADNIESGGSATRLDSSAVITDIIAPQFQLQEGATITLETYKCTGVDANGAYTWTKNDTAMGATASISGDEDDKVDVTGFNFSENWVGTETTNGGTPTYRGNKLVIKFNVQAKDDFLGGNNVYTNTSAGVYEDDEATSPVATFPKPQVNVPIKDVTVTAADKNVYLLGDLTAEQIKDGATANCGGIPIDLSKSDTAENWGLESWQNEYVNIEVTYTDKDGQTITGVSNLQADTTYTVAVTVKPKEGCTGANASGPVNDKNGKTGSDEGKINVFKPELTFKDSEVYYGDTAPTDYTGNKDSEVWKHDETLDTGVTMIGDKPTLDLTYTPDSTKVADNKIAVKSDIPVDVTVKIGEGDSATDVTNNTTFQHTNCVGKTCNVPEGKEFLLHVKTCSLTITKAASSLTGTTFGPNESFIFNISKDGGFYTQITISCDANGNIGQPVTISELPVGTYTVAEDTDWSWRYEASPASGNATLSATHDSDNVTVTNKLTTKQWLNGVSAIVKNVFGVPFTKAY